MSGNLGSLAANHGVMPLRPTWGTAQQWRHMYGSCAGAREHHPRKSECRYCRAAIERRTS